MRWGVDITIDPRPEEFKIVVAREASTEEYAAQSSDVCKKIFLGIKNVIIYGVCFISDHKDTTYER